IEEALDLARIRHAGDEQAEPEHQSRGEGGERVHASTCRITSTVANPASMNAAVATSERGDRRDSPHTPCPLVQPDPYAVPTPTSRPAATSAPKPASILGIGFLSKKKSIAAGASSNPPTKATRQAASLRLGNSKPPTIPLIPATRPLTRRSIAAAMP